MRAPRGILALLLAALPLAGCGSDRSRACEPCTNDDECESGLTCQAFRDNAGNIINLCGDANPDMTCPAR
jgi:hypothetical protein